MAKILLRQIIPASIALFLGLGCTSTDTVIPEQPPASMNPAEATYFTILNTTGDPYVVQPLPRESASGGAGSVMYPGDAGVGGFVASIFVHAAIQSSVTRAREKAFEQHTQTLLDPHREVLSFIDLGIVKEQATRRLHALNPQISDGAYVDGGYVIAVDPVFVLSHSSDAWGLATKVRVFTSLQHALAEEDAVYLREIYVGSLPRENSGWSQEELESVFLNLLAKTVSISFEDFLGRTPTTKASQETIRYLSNGKKQVERGYKIEQGEHMVLFQSLRGELKLVPIFASG